MRPGSKQPAQCVAESDGVGVVLAGSVRSIGLVIEDALRGDEGEAFVLSASGVPVRLLVRDAGGEPVAWKLREVVW